MNFSNKWVWITGASTGLGEALAYAFAQEGANLILSSRNEAELKRVQANCNPASKVIVQVLDMSQSTVFEEVTQKIIAQTGTIDVLVNNAGISQRSLAKETPLGIDRKIMEINYFGTIGLTKAVLPYFLKQQAGHFVAVSSLVGKIGSPLRSTYAASKHALHGFYDSLRAESVKDGIQVTLILPGYVRTNISINALTGDGSPQNKMDNKQEKGLSPEAFARKALRGIKQGKHEIYIGRREILAIYLKRFFPRLLANIISKVKVT
jgi:short-subunit dehydrogenase